MIIHPTLSLPPKDPPQLVHLIPILPIRAHDPEPIRRAHARAVVRRLPRLDGLPGARSEFGIEDARVGVVLGLAEGGSRNRFTVSEGKGGRVPARTTMGKRGAGREGEGDAVEPVAAAEGDGGDLG